MSQRLKNIIAILCALTLCVHFALVINYTHCFSKNNNSFSDKLSNVYTYPFFHQNWQLFTPPPKANYRLYVRTNNGRVWSEWRDLNNNIILENHRNRLSGNELKMLLFNNSISHIYYEVNDSTFEKEPDDINFKILNHSIKSELSTKGSFQTYEVMLVFDRGNNTQTYYYKHLF